VWLNHRAAHAVSPPKGQRCLKPSIEHKTSQARPRRIRPRRERVASVRLNVNITTPAQAVQGKLRPRKGQHDRGPNRPARAALPRRVMRTIFASVPSSALWECGNPVPFSDFQARWKEWESASVFTFPRFPRCVISIAQCEVLCMPGLLSAESALAESIAWRPGCQF
jgi:hypothetical protein